jgi:hypothetical protein
MIQLNILGSATCLSAERGIRGSVTLVVTSKDMTREIVLTRSEAAALGAVLTALATAA